MRSDQYIFPAIFTYAEDGISIEFPDLPGCLPCASSTEEALTNARQALGLHLYGMEEDGEDIPSPTPVEMIRTGEKQVLMLVDTWMPLIRDAVENRAVKKTLTIPAWLNTMAEANNVNFSQVLQAALKERLGLADRPSHSGIGITTDLYAHVSAPGREDAASAIDARLDPPKGATTLKRQKEKRP